jgi:large subunit ribosomal protein L9
VEQLGERGDVVSVAPGYARNYLLPKRLAMPATPGNLRTLEHRRRVWELKEAQETEAARALANRLAELALTVTKKAGESGTLYGSVTTAEIADLLAAKGVEIDRRRIVLDEPIKTVGTHEVSIKLHREVSGTVQLEVVNEQDGD